MKKLLILILLSTVFIFTACGGSGEDDPTDNPECTNNAQCDPGYICENQKCEAVFFCTDAQSCYDHDSNWNAETNPAVCVSGECREKGCKSNSDCVNSEVCNSGKCEVAQDCSMVDSVQIVTPSPILTQDSTKELKAIALNRNGVPVNTGNTPEWASSETSTVAVDANGVVTGGTTSGSSDITATICTKVSPALSVQNFATVDAGKLRVIVRNIDGDKIEGATVKIGGSTEQTNSDGFVIVDNAEAKNNITVTMAGYQAVSFLEVADKDLIVYLNAEVNKTKAGGYKGLFDFDHSTIKNNGEVRLGIAGVSLPGNILDLDFGLLLGEPIMRHIDTAGIELDMALPSGLVLIIGDNDVVSGDYKATGLDGDRTLWGWGGRASMVEVIAIVQDAMTEGMDNLDMGKLLSQLMPIAEKFNHAVKPSQNITLCDKIPDANDINGDGDTTDLIADFSSSCFPTVNLELNQPLSLSSLVKFPALPTIEGKKTEATILLASTNVEGKGMVPLGMGAGTDKKENTDTADGKIDDASFVYAPQHSGLSDNDSTVTLITMPIDKDAMDPDSEKELQVKMTGIVKFYKGGVIEDTINLSSETYLALAENAELKDNTVTFSAISGASLYRLSVVDTEGKVWVVYSPNTSISISDKPIGNIVTIVVQAVRLTKESTEISYSELLTFNSSNLDDLTKLISKFSAFQIDLAAK